MRMSRYPLLEYLIVSSRKQNEHDKINIEKNKGAH